MKTQFRKVATFYRRLTVWWGGRVGGKNLAPETIQRSAVNFRNFAELYPASLAKDWRIAFKLGNYTVNFKALFSLISTDFPELVLDIKSWKKREKVYFRSVLEFRLLNIKEKLIWGTNVLRLTDVFWNQTSCQLNYREKKKINVSSPSSIFFLSLMSLVFLAEFGSVGLFTHDRSISFLFVWKRQNMGRSNTIESGGKIQWESSYR